MTDAILECADITKSFGGVPVLKGITLDLQPGTVTALAGENQRNPTGDDTPASVAASSVIAPAAMAAQNRTRSCRQATVGRPGEGI